jgi:hypothetical protein
MWSRSRAASTASVAIAQHAGKVFHRFADLCAEEYRIEYNPPLAAKHARLMRSAVERGVAQSNAMRRSSRSPSHSQPPALDSVERRLRASNGRVELARCALAILCEQIQPERAFLYGMREGQAVLLASARDQPEPELLAGAFNVTSSANCCSKRRPRSCRCKARPTWS